MCVRGSKLDVVEVLCFRDQTLQGNRSIQHSVLFQVKLPELPNNSGIADVFVHLYLSSHMSLHLHKCTCFFFCVLLFFRITVHTKCEFASLLLMQSKFWSSFLKETTHFNLISQSVSVILFSAELGVKTI